MVTGNWGRRRYEADGFIQTLEKLGPPSSVFVAGPELLLRDEILVRLQRAVGGGSNDARWGREVHSAREAPLSEIASGLRVVGLFADTRFVIVSEVERYGRAGQADRADFWQWLDHPSPGVHLAFVSEKALWELERGSEFLKGTLARVDAVLRCDHPSAQGAVMILRRIGKEKYGLEITPRIAARFVDAIGPNLLELRQELDRLALRLGPGATIDEAALDNWLRSGIVGTLNDLESSILAGDRKMALRYWDAVRQNMNAPTVTWMIGNHFLDPRWGRQGAERVPSRLLLSRILHDCYVLERGVKTGEIPASLQETAFEEMIWRLCAGTGNDPGPEPAWKETE